VGNGELHREAQFILGRHNPHRVEIALGSVLLLVWSLTAIAHLWIKNQLRNCISSRLHWRTFAVLEREEEIIDELFRQADTCISVNEIWRIGTAKASLFYYTNTLATWFFGVNLVKFEHKANTGRSLEVT